MKLRWVNPLHYPLAMLGAGICLVLGVRIAKAPAVLVLPISGALAVGGAMVLAKDSPSSTTVPLRPELQTLISQAEDLKVKSEKLRQEAQNLLSGTTQVELLGAVQYACDRAQQLPPKLQTLSKQLNQTDVLLSEKDLQKQLGQVKQRIATSQGNAQHQLKELAQRLERNIELARQGADAQQSQLIALSGLVIDAGGVLQQLQTRLRTADLSSSKATAELQALSAEFNQYQDNVDLLLA